MKAGVAMAAIGWSGLAFAGGEGWIADFSAAKKQAAEANTDLLVDFTGSDWCGWCIKLNEEVFSHDAFKSGVKDKFVLVEIDFPQDKKKLSEATQKQNAELGEKYGVQGYPTILLTDASGKPYAATGYQKGGPEAYVKHLDELREKKAVRDEAFAAAAKSEGVEKAKGLVAALKAMDLTDAMVANFYGDVADQIKAADPKDETGFAKEAADKAKVAEFETKLRGFAEKEDYDGALALVDSTLKEGGFGPDETQQMILTKASLLAQQGKFDDAIKAVDEGKAASPESSMIPAIDGFRNQLEAAKKQPAAK
ncbi:MAG: thioredoxin family protein [Verrucomicrobiota bacterium]